jgi:hypothetical protein
MSFVMLSRTCITSIALALFATTVYAKEAPPSSLIPQMKTVLAEALQKYAANPSSFDHNPPEIVSITPRSNAWQIERNKMTGILVGRYVVSDVVYRKPKATTCYRELGSFREVSAGPDKWGPLEVKSVIQFLGSPNPANAVPCK